MNHTPVWSLWLSFPSPHLAVPCTYSLASPISGPNGLEIICRQDRGDIITKTETWYCSKTSHHAPGNTEHINSSILNQTANSSRVRIAHDVCPLAYATDPGASRTSRRRHRARCPGHARDLRRPCYVAGYGAPTVDLFGCGHTFCYYIMICAGLLTGCAGRAGERSSEMASILPTFSLVGSRGHCRVRKES